MAFIQVKRRLGEDVGRWAVLKVRWVERARTVRALKYPCANREGEPVTMFRERLRMWHVADRSEEESAAWRKQGSGGRAEPTGGYPSVTWVPSYSPSVESMFYSTCEGES